MLAALSIHGARDAAAQQVKWSSGTESPKLKAPANACDCHHHIYGSQYKVDPRSTARPSIGPARVRVADVGREEFDIPPRRRVAEIGDQRRHDVRRPLVDGEFGVLDRRRKL